ncbi:hypothetical protein [Mycobacteroides abscessus]|uniref:hypothetical protein n=1 Tax=Mycobacteroides abscessus TaxID=36809 RepID=UPI0009A5C9DF|nr:hypothetical protein [Mycobacteroides abscessus]SLH38376.1 Uncharacterised protein [Mycobacteroides abscessus subsp. massiliense]
MSAHQLAELAQSHPGWVSSGSTAVFTVAAVAHHAWHRVLTVLRTLRILVMAAVFAAITYGAVEVTANPDWSHPIPEPRFSYSR